MPLGEQQPFSRKGKHLLQLSYEALTACLARKKRILLRRTSMRDVAFVLVTALFFALAILYVRACERLK